MMEGSEIDSVGFTTMEHSNNSMENFRELVLKLAQSNESSLTPAGVTRVEGLLNKFFSEYEAPDHPPYSAMIERAIRELDEKGGSCFESISEFLKKEYSRLPYAHLLFLQLHLGKLCESGDIVAKHGKRYMLGDINLRSNLSNCDISSRKVFKQGLVMEEGWRERCRKQVEMQAEMAARFQHEDIRSSSFRKLTLYNKIQPGVGNESHLESLDEEMLAVEHQNKLRRGRPLKLASVGKEEHLESTDAKESVDDQQSKQCHGQGRPRKLTVCNKKRAFVGKEYLERVFEEKPVEDQQAKGQV